MKIWCDGGNNYIGEFCVLMENGTKYCLCEKRSTNNVMEYKAMLKALELAMNGDVIYSDSKLVVYQLKGWWQVKQDHLKSFYNNCKEMLESKNVNIRWVPRRKNNAGKLLSRKRKICSKKYF